MKRRFAVGSIFTLLEFFVVVAMIAILAGMFTHDRMYRFGLTYLLNQQGVAVIP